MAVKGKEEKGILLWSKKEGFTTGEKIKKTYNFPVLDSSESDLVRF